MAECVAEYGRDRSGGNPSLARGIARLSKHFDEMDNKFSGNTHVFEVIINKMVHHGESPGATPDDQDKHFAVNKFLRVLQHEIPRRYLHLDDSFQFSVGKKVLTFNYWSER